MNIAIIGCGYVGCAVAKYWQEKNNFVVTATTTTPARISELETLSQKVIVTKGNDYEGLKAALKNQDVVLLTVSAKGGDYETAYLQTAKTLVSILPEISTIRQVIYTGSYSVYGNRNGAVVDEETIVNPSNQNSIIMRQTEEVLLSAATDNLRVCILRLGGIYGPGRELIKIFGRVAGTTRPGTGDDITNWIHLDDIVGVIDLAREDNWQGIYNVVDDAHLINREFFAQLFAKHNLPSISWDTSQESNRPYNVWVSNQKIKDAGYELIHPQMIF
ncbi:SDR family oxidoreductase [Calothrix sp. FACHB-1219]|uniref:SDR family oxidoreductase n=1 Tax=unclassified Calothrix TaxID=2619626 RepID=UPI0016834368|nr:MULTISPECIES: SDR family oxidoreductase [unclassified Calothrix]MBD2207047.1 SDR family oxidoreductase [Calothrix sp. FACHB-168]MBD2221663.1 SDR family oxidoreductase [Calothrix sp. FACHB-1219]